jgi:hypothetical protein
MLQLSEFNLQLAFVALGPLGKYVENQAGTIQHANLEFVLEVSFLTRRQGVVENGQLGFMGGNQSGKFLNFALADEKPGIRLISFTDQRSYRQGSGRFGKLAQLADGLYVCIRASINQNGSLTGFRPVKQGFLWMMPGEIPGGRNTETRNRRSSNLFLGLFLRLGKPHLARGHDSGDGMLIDHLADGVFQNNYILIERINLALKFYSVDQINGNWNMFFP